MSIEIAHPDGQTFELTHAGWQAVLELAARRGWRAAEILAELKPPFRVNARDAATLAGIVEDVVGDVNRGVEVGGDNFVLNSLFSTRSAAHWLRFAAFCRAAEVTVRAADDGDEDDGWSPR